MVNPWDYKPNTEELKKFNSKVITFYKRVLHYLDTYEKETSIKALVEILEKQLKIVNDPKASSGLIDTWKRML